MLSSRIQRLATVGLVALAIAGTATDAFAIRNRYTNEQNEGFAALFFDAFGRQGFADEQPIERPYRRLSAGASRSRYHDRGGEDDPFAF